MWLLSDCLVKLSKKDCMVFLTVMFCSFACTNGQSDAQPYLVGGPCEGCEAVLEFEGSSLTSVDTLPDFDQPGVRIRIDGTVYLPDGDTPATEVIIYIYHTDQKGIYQSSEGAEGWARQHGYNRTWLRTDAAGRYAFYTLKPAPYPSRSEPAHIHYTILEPDGKYYWLHSVHFQGDSLLSDAEIRPQAPRGGPGLIALTKEDGIWTGTRDIVLGQSIPGYP